MRKWGKGLFILLLLLILALLNAVKKLNNQIKIMWMLDHGQAKKYFYYFYLYYYY